MNRRGVCLLGCQFHLPLNASHAEFFRLHLEHSTITIESVEFLFQDLFVGLFLFLQRLNLQQPPADDRLGSTACVDKMLDAFLVLLKVALVVDIKLLGHFLALATVIRRKHTVARHQSTAQVILPEGGDIVLQQIQLRQIRVGDKVQVAFNADFVGLHPVELILESLTAIFCH